MDQFKKGDRVRIKGGTLAGGEYIVEHKSEEPFNCDEDQYRIKNDQHPFGFDMREGNLELVETTESEKARNLFEEVMDGSYYNKDDVYMEGVKNHMIEAGIDPTVNNPKDYIYFQEMAGRIPGQIKVYKKGGDILIIAVGGRENRGESHFHVFRSEKDFKAWKNGACLLFKENKYFDHKDNVETLSKDELATMIQCLKSKPAKDLPGNTYWQYLIYLWNGGNYDWRIDINTPMPNYDYKTITRYKEKI